MTEHATDAPRGAIAAEMSRSTGSWPSRCYQCGRCAAGCPQNVAGEMDLSPTAILRILQLEDALAHDPPASVAHARRALSAEAPWLCAGCLACTAGCPQGVDVAGVMDLLRRESLRRGVAASTRRARDAQALHRGFLAHALRAGRVHELSVVAGFKLRTGHLLADVSLAPGLLRRGKLRLARPQAPDAGRVRDAVAALRRDREGGE